MQTSTRSGVRRILGRSLSVILLALWAAGGAGAQARDLKILGSFLSVGGYFMGSGSAHRAIGDSKFMSDTELLTRPKHLGQIELSGGVEIFSATDHFLPFTGGNDFSLIGPVARVTTKRVLGQLRPFASVGLFAGRVRSVAQGFDRTDFTPSLAVGVDWPFARYFTLSAGYRFSERINGVDTDGFMLSLRVF